MVYPEIKRIACVGVGVIGASWAVNFSMKGFDVNMYHAKPDRLEVGMGKVDNIFNVLISADVISEDEAAEAKKHIYKYTSLEDAVSNVQLIVESLPERYDIKEETLQRIDKVRGEDVIYATSTSGLLISEIAKYSKYPQRCVCAHPYNPPHLIPLVELVGPEGSDEAIEHLKKFFVSVGKEPVIVKKEVPGFIANRLQTALAREVIDLVMNGVCTVEDADKALTFGPGIRWAVMGQNLLYQLGGGDGGVKGLYSKIGGTDPNRKTWLDDMAKWTKYPVDWPDIAQKGVDEEMADRPPELGNTNASLAAYRDKMLIGILKLHNKL